jgi:heptosyltransferase-2
MRATAFELAGVVGLGGLKALVQRARVLVANDAGARHLAVAFGVPCVVVMGPTALEKTNLNLERVSVLTADVACRPCYLRDCPIDHRCMTRVPPALVAAEGARALAAGGRYAGVQRVVGGLAA